MRTVNIWDNILSMILTSYYKLFFLIQAIAMVKKTPAYRNKLKALEFERSGGVTNKKKNSRQMNKYVLSLYWIESATILA